MPVYLKTLLFLAINAAGFFITPLLGNLTVAMGLTPELPTDIAIRSFQLWFAGGGVWSWLACALISIGYFFASEKHRTGLLLLPLYGPLLYGLSVLAYFHLA
ncbi:MAG: hypothetical protein H6868_00505 [Rhodospirillales bacterium]|nr:hypothetical protein [Rhodospirillales bacterium]